MNFLLCLIFTGCNVKIISKVLTCRCYKNEFLDFADNSFCAYRIHMKYMCRRKHSFYVLFCEENTYGSKFIGRGIFKIEEECKSKNGAPQEVCNFCFSVRYTLNFKCDKFCLSKLPDIFVDKVVPLGDHLKKIDCDPFFLSL